MIIAIQLAAWVLLTPMITQNRTNWLVIGQLITINTLALLVITLYTSIILE